MGGRRTLAVLMLALAVLQVPFKAGAHVEKIEGAAHTLTAEKDPL